MSYLLVLNTCPDREVAEKIAHALLEKKLAACINILPELTSVYRWQGKIETARECLLTIKTHSDHYQAVEDCLLSIHPYELPEIIAVPIERGHTDYLQWIDSCLT